MTPLLCVSSRYPTESYYRFDVFVKSLGRLGAQATVLGMGEPWHGLMTKPFMFRKWLSENAAKHPRVIICDCWDIMLTRHPDVLDDECRQLFGDTIVFNGERGCWPCTDLADSFPDKGTPWRYLNSGFMCGPSEQILTLLVSMNLEAVGVDRVNADGSKTEPNDQGEFQKAFAKQPVPMTVDGLCQVAQTFSGCSPDEFDISSHGVMNRVTGSCPGALHFNGGSKNDIMPLVMEALKLS